MAYRCLNCGAVLPRLQVYIRWQSNPNADPPSYEGCAYCHSDNVVKVRQCIICGEFESVGYELIDKGDFVCKKCLTEVDYGADL